ncbi:MAG: nucleotidyltransferase domain-containing protein [Sumerlaeia bacterium]
MALQVSNLPEILSAGTQVVVEKTLRGAAGEPICPQGAVGVVVGEPDTADGLYRVRFPNAYEADLARGDFDVRKHYQRRSLGDLAGLNDGVDWRRHIIYRCVIGSRAYGLDTDDSDTDRRGIFLPPARLHWSLAGVPEQIEDHPRQECFWELEKFLTLALKANPNVLEVLHSDLVEHCAPIAGELCAMRGAFLSRLVYQTYNGYVLSQFKKMRHDLDTRGEVRWKHAMHLIRLLWSGKELVRTGQMVVRIHDGAMVERLLAIKRGEWTFEAVEQWRQRLHREFDDALARTPLPELPDIRRADAFLIRARHRMTETEEIAR